MICQCVGGPCDGRLLSVDTDYTIVVHRPDLGPIICLTEAPIELTTEPVPTHRYWVKQYKNRQVLVHESLLNKRKFT
jgi:hypothetical protein